MGTPLSGFAVPEFPRVSDAAPLHVDPAPGQLVKETPQSSRLRARALWGSLCFSAGMGCLLRPFLSKVLMTAAMLKCFWAHNGPAAVRSLPPQSAAGSEDKMKKKLSLADSTLPGRCYKRKRELLQFH